MGYCKLYDQTVDEDDDPDCGAAHMLFEDVMNCGECGQFQEAQFEKSRSALETEKMDNVDSFKMALSTVETEE